MDDNSHGERRWSEPGKSKENSEARLDPVHGMDANSHHSWEYSEHRLLILLFRKFKTHRSTMESKVASEFNELKFDWLFEQYEPYHDKNDYHSDADDEE